MEQKIYVDVLGLWAKDGKIIPKAIKVDGERHKIDRVIDTRPASSLKTAQEGIRYTIQIGQRRDYLFRAGDRWYLVLRHGM